MSVRATTRRGKLVWLVQVIRGGGSFNRRRYLDRRVFRKADAEAVEAELLAEYAAGAHNHEERGGAENTSKNAGSDRASRQAGEVLALATVRPTTAQSVGGRTISTGADARASSSCSSATTSTPGGTEARAGEEPAESSPSRRRGRRAGGEISPAREIASPTASKISATSVISPAAPATRAPTFADFAERFLALQDPTRSDYRNKDRNLRLHLVPVLGAMRLDAINRMVIDGLKVKLRTPSGHVPSSPRSLSRKEAPLSHRRWGGPRSPKTINNVLTTLRGVLGLAYDYELIPRIPRIKMEPVPKRDPGFLTEAEVERLLAAAPATWRLLLLTAAYTGLRRGELLALRWGDLHTDAARPFIRVQRSLQYLRSREVREKGPKGGRPRSVPMTAALTGELLARRPADASATDLVFADEAGGYVDYRELWRVLSRAAKDAGLRKHVHPHLLRHTFASHCYMRGVPPQVVQLWLGHAHISTTERYAHLAPNTGEDLIDLVAPTVRMIRGNTTTNTKVSPKLKTASEGA